MTQPAELHHPIPKPPKPPRPPEPGEEEELERLRETVEVQARTIRYLLSNYEMLLRKVEKHEDEEDIAVYSVGPAQTFQQNAAIPLGWWMVISSGSHSIHHDHEGQSHSHTYEQFEVLFSTGTAHKTSGSLQLSPIITKIERVKKEE